MKFPSDRRAKPSTIAFRIALLLSSAMQSGPALAADPALVPGFSFELRMSKEDYVKEVAALDQDRIDPAKVEASPVPAFSSIITGVTAGTPAAQAGVGVGWRVTALNGREVWHRLEPWEPDDQGKREMTFVTPKGERKKLSFEPGKIGTFTVNSRRLEVAALHLTPRGPWDRDLMVAAVAWTAGDHDLSETALRAAMNRGMPAGTVLYHFGSLIALDHGDIKMAKELNTRVMNSFPAPPGKGKEHEKEIPRFYREGIRELGLATGDYRLFARANRENEGLNTPALLPAMADQWIQWSITDDHGSLLPDVMKLQGPDLLAKCEKFVPRWQAKTDFFNFDKARAGRYLEEVPPGKFDRQSFAPPGAVRDMVWHVRFSFREYGKPAPQRNNFLYFALMDRQMKSQAAAHPGSAYLDRSVLYLQIMRFPEDDRQEVGVGIGPCYSWVEMSPNLPSMSVEEFDSFKKMIWAKDPKSHEVKRRVHDLTLIRSGNIAEIVLNGRTLMRAPVDPAVEDLYATFHSEGISFAIDGMTIHQIGTE
ncbi:hypothetical protein [Luteolibacter soli]|uniref:PDZ domain-containing protein n=1 Tax=Luteolibacter soli TaxID=3135280 RepID=A0ABU9AYK2_9BACT